jgi:superfamily II DNA helicase RecQ
MAPRQLQLQAALVELTGFDTMIVLGTGSGKTLAITIPHILLPDRVSFIISPLKQLQLTQVRSLLHSCFNQARIIIIRSVPLSNGVSGQLW